MIQDSWFVTQTAKRISYHLRTLFHAYSGLWGPSFSPDHFAPKPNERMMKQRWSIYFPHLKISNIYQPLPPGTDVLLPPGWQLEESQKETGSWATWVRDEFWWRVCCLLVVKTIFLFTSRIHDYLHFYIHISYSFSTCELVPDGRTCSIVSCLHSRVHLWEKPSLTPLSKSHWLHPIDK